MGDSITEGDLTEVLKGIGDSVALDEVVAIVETDKVNVDIRSPVTGVVDTLNAEEGDTVEVGAALMTIKLGEGAAAPPPSKKQEAVMIEETKPDEQPKPDVGDAEDHSRIPLIRFRYGSRDAINASMGIVSTSSTQGHQATKSSTEESKPVFDFSEAAKPQEYLRTLNELLQYTGIPTKYQRTPLSEYQIQLVEMGGAEPY